MEANNTNKLIGSSTAVISTAITDQIFQLKGDEIIKAVDANVNKSKEHPYKRAIRIGISVFILEFIGDLYDGKENQESHAEESK